MDVKDTKVHITGSIIDYDDSTFDVEDSNGPLKEVQRSLAQNRIEIKNQKTASHNMQIQLNGMTDQLEKILLALGTRPVDNLSAAVSPDDGNYDDDNTYNRYYKSQGETVNSVPLNNPSSHENSVIVLGQGETFLWKSKSGLYFHITVISITFQQASSTLHYKIMSASDRMTT